MISHALNHILQVRRLYVGAAIVVLIVGLILRLIFVFSDLETVIQVVPDDTYYYLRVAQHIVAGDGSSFDGLTLTNGYHPLWMALLLPIAALFSDPVVLVRVVLLLCVIIELMTVVVMMLWLKRVTSMVWLAALAGSLVYNRVPLFVQSMFGLEFAIGNLVFVLTLWALYEFLVADNPDELRQHVRLGVLLGLLFLARTDNVVYVVVFGLLIFFSHELPLVRRIQQRSKPGLIALAMVLPWLIWSYIQFGSIIQDSGMATALVLGERFQPDSVGQGVTAIINSLFIEYPRRLGYTNPAAFSGLTIALVALIGLQWRRFSMAHRRLAGLLLLALIAAQALYIVHNNVRGIVRSWYFGTHAILHLLLFVVVMIASLSPFIRKNLRREDDSEHVARVQSPPISPMYRVLHGFLALAIIAPVLSVLSPSARAFVTGQAAPYPHQTEMLAAAYWLRDNTSDDAVGSAFNAGIIGYYSERSVINLDGLVNTSAYHALEDHALFAYIEQSPITHYLDYHPLMLDWYQPFLGEDESMLTLHAVDEIPPHSGGYMGATLQIFDVERSSD